MVDAVPGATQGHAGWGASQAQETGQRRARTGGPSQVVRSTLLDKTIGRVPCRWLLAPDTPQLFMGMFTFFFKNRSFWVNLFTMSPSLTCTAHPEWERGAGSQPGIRLRAVIVASPAQHTCARCARREKGGNGPQRWLPATPLCPSCRRQRGPVPRERGRSLFVDVWALHSA